ncbi:DoxX family protein [Paenibacillus periandrae]|uniref:DoxX family protein n=1 Tax=Paenibacillus periandrae TaxID=1761741 RepID=UPI003B834EAC
MAAQRDLFTGLLVVGWNTINQVRKGAFTMKNGKMKTILYWVTTIFGPASFVIGGFLFVTHGEQQVAVLNQLGYPVYVATILGVWKLLGVIAIVIPRFPRLKEWAYAGFFFELSGAAASHALSGDGLALTAQPLVFLALVIASWALRPSSRKLVAQ